MEPLLISNLSKTYSNGVKALQNINLAIPVGMFGLLGPNGAGKSTLMRTIATLQAPDTGTITMGNINVLNDKTRVRELLGYMPQEFGLYPHIPAYDLLDHLAVLKGYHNRKNRKNAVDALLQKTNLYEHRKKRLGTFSGGMKRRFGIAQALLADPRLIIVDEPTAGLDPTERYRFHELLCEVGRQAIIILSTHIVEDVKELCTQMAIINKGQVLLQANPIETIEEMKNKVFSKSINKKELADYKHSYRVISERLFQGKPLIHILSERDPGQGFIPVEADLNDVYFSQIFA